MQLINKQIRDAEILNEFIDMIQEHAKTYFPYVKVTRAKIIKHMKLTVHAESIITGIEYIDEMENEKW